MGHNSLVSHKKAVLARQVRYPLKVLAERVEGLWEQAEALDRVLEERVLSLPNCHLIYVLNHDLRQFSSNVTPHGADPRFRGQDLSHDAYLTVSLPYEGFVLSEIYISPREGEPCLTAVQAVRNGKELLGFIAADFRVRSLAVDNDLLLTSERWQQFKGDPAIRSTLWMQHRNQSLMDAHLNEVLLTVESLMRYHGVFQADLYFSSSRALFWHMDNPFVYTPRGGADQGITPDICVDFPMREYPARSKVAQEKIRQVLNQCRVLRTADETLYLRSASLNIISGMVSLNFSCDGSHYMSVDEFLERDTGFWLGGVSREAQQADIQGADVPGAGADCRARVMVVEDDEVLARYFAELLQTAGHEPVVFHDPDAAFGYYFQQPAAIDILLTDEHMPGLSGHQLAHAMLNQRPGLPVILCTGYPEKIEQIRRAVPGIRHVFEKPVDGQLLLDTVCGLMREGDEEPQGFRRRFSS